MSTASIPIPLELSPSFGFGDRLGLATPGHFAALEEAGGPIQGIFAQQSIREMQRTARTPSQVMQDAREALDTNGFTGVCGADADHLKTEEDVEYTAAAGFTFFTIDPSDYVDQQADDYDASQLEKAFASVQHEIPWIEQYQGKSVSIPDGPEIHFDEMSVKRAAVKYGRAIAHAQSLAVFIKEHTARLGQDHEIELSVDETEQATTLAEHYIFAEQLTLHTSRLVSLAPRFIGDFEKGVDFKGDLSALEESLQQHAAIARALGPYKLSLHSGSDKLSMYAALARTTKGLFHVKTAGTSYLEAVRVAALHDEELFRRIVTFSRERYDTDKATYHVSAQVENCPAPESVSETKVLEQEYLECWEDVEEGKGFTKPGRQILHCTFGSVLTHQELGADLRALLLRQPDAHKDILRDHFARHLRALCAGLT